MSVAGNLWRRVRGPSEFHPAKMLEKHLTMTISKRFASAVIVGLAVLTVSYARADSGTFQSAVSTSQLDPAALVQWVDGAEQPLKNADGTPAVPEEIVVTEDTKKLKALTFGKSVTPGPRHVRIGFLEPVKAGTILAVGDVSVSILKPDASYPGNPGTIPYGCRFSAWPTAN